MENREHNRFRGLKDYTKSIADLGKQLKIPGLTQATNLEQKNAIGTPVAGTGFMRILMYIIAGILFIGIILLGVDQWITPIFQRGPGSPDGQPSSRRAHRSLAARIHRRPPHGGRRERSVDEQVPSPC